MRQCPICGAAHATCGGPALTKYPPLGSNWEVRMEGGAQFTSDRRLYLDKDGNVVEDDDPNKLTLLVAEGGSIPMARAQELGLTVTETDDTGDGEKPARAAAKPIARKK